MNECRSNKKRLMAWPCLAEKQIEKLLETEELGDRLPPARDVQSRVEKRALLNVRTHSLDL